ncbi:hypothetical protein [Cryptosporangium arvum]|uniref:hypothetical protein n=1 Tax=Cryptosporangium arvum TaxID=80871 RepID=UPI0004AEC0D5|nr:hypothetical protein [Cryptosporangium arvum]
MPVAACLVSATAPLLLFAWSETDAIVAAVVVFGLLLLGPDVIDRRLADFDRADRLADAWVRGEPGADEVELLVHGPDRVADPDRAWRSLVRAGLLRRRSTHSELPAVYAGALLGGGFGLVSVVAVVVIDAIRVQSPSLAALSVAGVMLVFAGVQFVARWAAARAGERLAWLDVDDPRTLAGRRALHLLAARRHRPH